jgi:hypothetical protein
MITILLAAFGGLLVGLVFGFGLGICSALDYVKQVQLRTRGVWAQIGEDARMPK